MSDSALTDAENDDKGEDFDADAITETISREEHVSVLNLSARQNYPGLPRRRGL